MLTVWSTIVGPTILRLNLMRLCDCGVRATPLDRSKWMLWITGSLHDVTAAFAAREPEVELLG